MIGGKRGFMERVRIGIVGLNFGKYILEKITQGEGRQWIELAAVCDMDAAKAKMFGEQYHVPYYTSIADLVANRSIPAVGLYTGPNGRAKLIDQLLDAGKHIMTTKPFELDAAEAQRVLKRAAEKKLVLHLNSPAPRNPSDIQQIMQWQQEYALGRPVAARADIWARYNESADGSWYDDPERCPVAPIFRLGIYLINDLVQILGEPTKISVMQSRIFTKRPTSDNAQLMLEFASGAIGSVFASFCVGDGQHYRNALTVNFDKGTIYRNVGPCDVARKMELVTQKSDGSTIEQTLICNPPMSGDYQWDTFAKAVHGDEALTSPPEVVVASVRVLSALIRAQRTGQTERV